MKKMAAMGLGYLVILVIISFSEGCVQISENLTDNNALNSHDKMPAINYSLVDNQTCTAETGEAMNLTEALHIASEGICTQNASLTDRHFCNENSGTWWIDLELNEPEQGCNPACVVFVQSRSSEINWRCTGLVQNS
jgi:hypothetical protein